MDIHSKLEHAQDELWCMENACDALAEVQGMEHVIDIIRGAMIVKGFEVEQYQRMVEEQDAKEQKELVREYYRSVI